MLFFCRNVQETAKTNPSLYYIILPSFDAFPGKKGKKCIINYFEDHSVNYTCYPTLQEAKTNIKENTSGIFEVSINNTNLIVQENHQLTLQLKSVARTKNDVAVWQYYRIIRNIKNSGSVTITLAEEFPQKQSPLHHVCKV